jgi:hypothetical protein
MRLIARSRKSARTVEGEFGMEEVNRVGPAANWDYAMAVASDGKLSSGVCCGQLK